MKTAVRWLAPFFLVLLAAHFIVLEPQHEQLEELRASLEKAKAEYVVKKKQAVNLDLLRAQLREADAAFGLLLHALPGRFYREFDEVLRAARNRGLRIEALLPEPQEQSREFYAELSARLKVSGRFHDLGRFAADLAQAPGSLLLHGLSLDATAPGQVTLEATLRTFRYIDDEEIAAQRKKARAAKGAKK